MPQTSIKTYEEAIRNPHGNQPKTYEWFVSAIQEWNNLAEDTVRKFEEDPHFVTEEEAKRALERLVRAEALEAALEINGPFQFLYEETRRIRFKVISILNRKANDRRKTERDAKRAGMVHINRRAVITWKFAGSPVTTVLVVWRENGAWTFDTRTMTPSSKLRLARVLRRANDFVVQTQQLKWQFKTTIVPW